MANLVNDPAHWAERAATMRRFAEQTQQESVRQAMLRVAADYDKLAERATARSSGRRAPSAPTLRAAHSR